MTRSKVIGGQIVTVIWRQIVIVMVALFQIAPAWTGSLRLQPNLNHRCTMGTFTLWRTSRSHDKVKCHFRSTSLKLVLIFCLRSFLLWYCYICNFLTSRVTHVFFALNYSKQPSMNISFISNQVWLIAALHEPSYMYLCHLYFVGCLIPNTISSLSHQYRCTLMASFKFLVHRLTLITTKVTWIIGTLWEASCLTYFKVTWQGQRSF